jgi:hypothetical protein
MFRLFEKPPSGHKHQKCKIYKLFIHKQFICLFICTVIQHNRTFHSTSVSLAKEIVWHAMDWAFFGSAQEPVANCCEHGNEPPFSTKRREFLDQPGDYKILNEDTDL